MRIAELSSEVLERIKTLRYDNIIEKHEGPWKWASEFEYNAPEFVQLAGYDVLLPIDSENHSHLTVLRCIASENKNTLTIFLKDTTFSTDPNDEWYDAGRLAICERLSDTECFVATVYHEWFIVENPKL